MTDWQEVTVLDLADGKRELFNDGDWIESPYITDSGNRLLQTGNVGVGRLLNRGTKRYISDASFRTFKCKEVVPGDVLICRLADPAGRACIVEDIGERRMLTSVDVTIYRPDPRKADRRFLVAMLSTPAWFQEVSERCGGSTRTRIARSELGKIKLRIPGIEEQKRIADGLAGIDDLIAALEQMIAKKQAIKQGMMQQLLTGKTRLPGFTDPWQEGTFEQLASPSRERAMPQSVAGTTPLVDLDQIEGGSGRLISMSEASEAVSLKAVFTPGDVLFGKLRAYLRKFWYADVDGLCTTEIWVLRAKPGVHSRFVRYIVETDQFIGAASGAYGTHMPRSDWGTVRALPVTIPPPDEQVAIASALGDVYTEIGLLHQRLTKARDIKQGMMQELLTGRTRLPVEATV